MRLSVMAPAAVPAAMMATAVMPAAMVAAAMVAATAVLGDCRTRKHQSRENGGYEG
jgi:hypothetical protein